MPKNPTLQWFKDQDRMILNDKLRKRPDLIEQLSGRIESYKRWQLRNWLCEAYDLEENVDQFISIYDSKRVQRTYRNDLEEWQKVSVFIFKRDSFTCTYCKEVGGILEVDHIHPFSKGGSNDLKNLTTACRRCNRQKKDKSVEEFYRWRAERG